MCKEWHCVSNWIKSWSTFCKANSKCVILYGQTGKYLWLQGTRNSPDLLDMSTLNPKLSVYFVLHVRYSKWIRLYNQVSSEKLQMSGKAQNVFAYTVTCQTHKWTLPNSTYKFAMLLSRAERSPTFQDSGTPYYGLAGTRVLASLIEQLSVGGRANLT